MMGVAVMVFVVTVAPGDDRLCGISRGGLLADR